ncbi:MAG: hypothetical protein V3S24_14215, partial [Candidatus Tectomicrobia bacterium]
ASIYPISLDIAPWFYTLSPTVKGTEVAIGLFSMSACNRLPNNVSRTADIFAWVAAELFYP